MSNTKPTTAAAPATLTSAEELDFAIGGLRDDGGIELVARNSEELLARIEDTEVAAQQLEHMARLIRLNGEAAEGKAAQ